MGFSRHFLSVERAVLGHGKKAQTPDPLTFAFPAGAVTGLIGHNGAGKTTLLRAIIGENVLLSGSIFLGDEKRNLRELSPRDFAALVAYVPQEHIYPREMRLRDLLALAYLPRLGFFGAISAQQAAEIETAIASFTLQDFRDQPLRKLSTGERQRAFLARALLQRPRILLLDEPTNHLDPAAIAAFWEILLEKQKEYSFDVLVSTHDLAFVKSHCTWICALKKGRLIYSGEAETFWESELIDSLFGRKL